MSARDKNWKNFIKLCAQIQSLQQLEDVFNLFFTKAEQEDISARFQIIFSFLTSKTTQRELAKKLNISIAKITRGSNALRITNETTKNLIKHFGK